MQRTLQIQNQPGDAVAGLPDDGTSQRDGSTLLIVMVLLGMLSLIGFLFYTYAAQERSSATYWADAQKVYTAELDPDALFDWSLYQLIVGPDDSLTQTALAGRRHSMLPNLFGRDIHPYNSAGVKLGAFNGIPFIDQDSDGSADGVTATTPAGQAALQLNDAAVANGGQYPRNISNDPANPTPYIPVPDPGVDYTYPDINTSFLAYKGYAVDANGNTVQVIIPSFHRPQLLRYDAGGGFGVPSPTWYQDAMFAGKVLRPHPSHLSPDGNPRYPSTMPNGTLTTAFPFMPGVAGQQGVWSLPSAYVFGTTTLPAYEWDVDNDGDGIKEGVWLDLQYPVQSTSTGEKFVPMFSFTVYDADGLFNLNAHGNLGGLVKMAASGYTNIGQIGNMTSFLSTSSQGVSPSEVNPQYTLNSYPTPGPDFSGTATDLDNATKQYQYEFGGTTYTDIQMSNFDWYRLLTGTANFQSTTTYNDLYPGRYGEATSVLNPAFQFGISNGSIAATPLIRLPFPGVTGTDDNWNLVEGQYGWELRSGMPGITASGVPRALTYTPNTPQFYPGPFSYFASYPYGQPLDFKGNGTIVATGTFGKTRLAISNTSISPLSSMKYPQYVGYSNPGGKSTATVAGPADQTDLDSVDVGWDPNMPTPGQQMIGYDGLPYFTGPNQGPLTAYQMDEDAETIVDTASASRSDSIFDFSENAAWHLSATDRIKLSLGSRSRTLMPFNLSSSARADSSLLGDGISKRFTTATFDRKQHGLAADGVHRPWETATGTFPPQFGAVGTYNTLDPLRPPVRKLLELTVGNTIDFTKRQFRLSINHLTTTDPNANIIQRPITPHDPTLTNAVGSSTQEQLARLDRQQFARDIYVMLYLLGGGLDFAAGSATPQNDHLGVALSASGYLGDNSINASGQRSLYTDRQLREMAQFAVNVVNALDADHVMTKFEYDKNLGNGWGDGTTALDDDPYTDDGYVRYATGDPKFNAEYPEDSDERGVVFGVEALQLTFSEVMAFKCPQVTMGGIPTDFRSTLHDDKQDRYFAFMELRNIGVDTVNFSNINNLGHWRIRVVSGPEGTTPVERRVTLINGSIAAGELYTIGNAGQLDGTAPAANMDFDTPAASRPAPPADKNHSRFRVDFNNNESDPHDFANTTTTWIGPAASNMKLDLDLITDRGLNKFQLTDSNSTPYDDTDDLDITSGPSERVGGFLNGSTILNVNNPVTFILERRQYPDRREPTLTNAAQQADNPWVPVDVFSLASLPQCQFSLSSPTAANIRAQLALVAARERIEPLRRPTTALDTSTHIQAPQPYSTLMNENNGISTPFPTWQVVYDRPLASPVELFHIPLFGPRNVTKWSRMAMMGPRSQSKEFKTQFDDLAPSGSVVQNSIPRAATASGKILQPEEYNNVVTNMMGTPNTKVPANDNRWYRLFEFFEAPTRTHRQLGNPLNVVRTPGRMNLNCFRHPDVFAGLLDDSDVMRLSGMSTARPTLMAQDGGDADVAMIASSQNAAVLPQRDWWVQFLEARDGRRTYNTTDLDSNNNPIVKMYPDYVTSLFLPGLADSSPFRSFSSLGFTRIPGTFESPELALDQTLFRRLPLDLRQQTTPGGNPDTDATYNVRHLWEVGAAGDHQVPSPGLPAVEPQMADRLLSKIYNNTTTRSHVFLVFVTVKFFQADDSAGAANVRIGGPLTTTPTYRGFFVIDRSNPEEAYDVSSGKFTNFRSLIKYRLRID